MRSFAKGIGFAVVAETIGNMQDLRDRRSRGESWACLDLWNQRSFWLGDRSVRLRNRHYSVLSITPASTYAVLSATPAGSIAVVIAPPHRDVRSASVRIRRDLEARAHDLMRVLSMDYANVLWILDGPDARFLKIQTDWPRLLPSHLAAQIAALLRPSLLG